MRAEDGAPHHRPRPALPGAAFRRHTHGRKAARSFAPVAVSVAAFYATILHGLSIEARDGVPLERLRSTVDHAVALWDSLVRQPVE
ncbi:hypothetical protein ACFWM7_06275 [Streptomyces sp. NPDC058375]|uniref:hypothetical protein n=1 Tax=Streptomyces sp. NPDC058375 TaxID=3346467 RepID=UPI003664133A